MNYEIVKNLMLSGHDFSHMLGNNNFIVKNMYSPYFISFALDDYFPFI